MPSLLGRCVVLALCVPHAAGWFSSLAPAEHPAHAHGSSGQFPPTRGHGADVGAKGASKEVEDVEAQLVLMRALEGDMERDLAAILAAVRVHGQALIRMEEVSKAFDSEMRAW